MRFRPNCDPWVLTARARMVRVGGRDRVFRFDGSQIVQGNRFGCVVGGGVRGPVPRDSGGHRQIVDTVAFVRGAMESRRGAVALQVMDLG